MIHTRLMMHVDNHAGHQICSKNLISEEVTTCVRTCLLYSRKTILKKMRGFFAIIAKLYRISFLTALQTDGLIGLISRVRLPATRHTDLPVIFLIYMRLLISLRQKEQKYLE